MLEDISSLTAIADITIKYVAPIVGLVGGTGGAIAYRKFRRTKDIRLYENIKRPFAIISTEQQSLAQEKGLLERTKFFKPKHFGVGGDSLNLLRDIKPRLLVVGYSPSSTLYAEAVKYGRDNSLPVIVFAPQHKMSNEEFAEMSKYSFGAVCQTELRLITDIFSVMSTFPEDK